MVPTAGSGQPRAAEQDAQRVPIYRLMKKAEFAGVLVEPFNEYQQNRYIR